MGSKITSRKTNTASGGGSGSTTSKSTNTSSTAANTDYQALINSAVAKGDYASAAQYEVQRNDKINSMNAAGTNTGGYTATNNYSQYLNTAPSGFNGSATGVTTYNPQQTTIQNQMNANSQEWWTATPERKAELEAANKALAAQLGGSVSWDPNTGYWGGAADAPIETGDKPTFDYSVAQPNFGNTYGSALDDMLNKILTREDFSYNPEEDQLYKYYQDMYRREGDRAMSNTLAEVASGAGGMNSYAITAAQQANNYYNSQMADKVPELYQLAYQMYLDDKASMVEDLGLLQQMDSTQYNRYRDTMSDWRGDRDFVYGQYRDEMGDWQWETNFNYGVSQDNINNAWKEKEWDYGVSNDQYNREQAERENAYNRALDLISAGVTPDATLLQQAGLTTAQVQQMITNMQASKPSTSSNGGGGGNPDESVGMDLDGLFEAAYASDSPEVFLENSSYLKKYGVGKYSDNLLSEYKKWAEPKETEKLQRILDSSTTNLGIGPIDSDYVEKELKPKGAVVVTENGYEWADGWNAENYKDRLKLYTTQGPGYLANW